jgi:hypothetical protein
MGYPTDLDVSPLISQRSARDARGHPAQISPGFGVRILLARITAGSFGVVGTTRIHIVPASRRYLGEILLKSSTDRPAQFQ